MNRDEIIRLAVEAGFARTKMHGALERFANLVAAAEREACAKLCTDKAVWCESKAQEAIKNGERNEVTAIRSTAWQLANCAADIQRRGQK